jgi:nitrogenase-stabilizing/protective protein
MDELTRRLKELSSAEDFLQFFGIAYDAPVVHVNRLHILKRFYQYLHRETGLAALDEVALFRRYRELLQNAYGDFLHSTPAQEKVFKVFQDADGRQHVTLAKVRDSLGERRGAAQAA